MSLPIRISGSVINPTVTLNYDPITCVVDIPGIGKVPTKALMQAALASENTGFGGGSDQVRFDEASLLVSSRIDDTNAIARLRNELADRGLPVQGMNSGEVVDLVLALAFNTGIGGPGYGNDR